MVGSKFMFKTMIALFTLPLVANAHINIDLKPLTQLVTQQVAGGPDVDTKQLQAATKALASTARMNAPVYTEEERDIEKTDRQHMEELFANIDALSNKAERTE